MHAFLQTHKYTYTRRQLYARIGPVRGCVGKLGRNVVVEHVVQVSLQAQTVSVPSDHHEVDWSTNTILNPEP